MAAAAWIGVGLAGQACFAARVLVQWIASERAGRTAVPRAYWTLGIAGGVLVLVYAAASGNAVFTLSVLPGLFASLRNLRLRRARGRVALALIMLPLAAAAVAALILQPRVGPPAWAALGFLGAASWSLRTFVQWWISERRGASRLPPPYWWLSLGGALLLLAYAVQRRDPVMIPGYALALVPYARNLMLAARGARRADKVRP